MFPIMLYHSKTYISKPILGVIYHYTFAQYIVSHVIQ